MSEIRINDVTGVPLPGGDFIFPFSHDHGENNGNRKMVLVSNTGQKIKIGYLPLTNLEWSEPSTWLDRDVDHFDVLNFSGEKSGEFDLMFENIELKNMSKI